MTIAKRETLPAANTGHEYERPDNWRSGAACATRGVDDWLWLEHPPSDEEIALTEARTICGSCPSARSCLEYALSDLSLVGIWAATTLNDRRRMARNQGRKSRAKEADE